MRSSPASYQALTEQIAAHLSCLRPAQQRGLARWVSGAIVAGSICQTAVLTALCTVERERHALRQVLREWLYDGQDKAAPCATQVEVRACFVSLLRWLLSLWQDEHLALAVDATSRGPALTALVVSVLYRGTAIPVAWVILPGTEKGAWMPQILWLLRLLAPAIPADRHVLVLADRGLWSPRLWKRIKDLHWHPLLRLTGSTTFAPRGLPRQPARHLIAGPGHAWIGEGVAFKDARRRRGTLLVVWAEGQKDPWLVLTDLRPRQVGVAWYGARMWIELGFKALKGMGWHWDKTRATDPERVARQWLILAVASLLTLATATRMEDAALLGRPPTMVHQPPRHPCSRPSGACRTVSLIALGMAELRVQFLRGRLWSRLWLRPEPWPDPLTDITITYHDAP